MTTMPQPKGKRRGEGGKEETARHDRYRSKGGGGKEREKFLLGKTIDQKQKGEADQDKTR